MKEENEYEKEEIIENLQKLGFTLNDSKVYFSLLMLGKSNPANIAEISGVDRARVYDSLKRLTKKQIVEEEPVKRAPQYKAKPPNRVFGKLRTNFNSMIKLSNSLEKKLSVFQTPIKEPSVWAVNGPANITRTIIRLIDNAESNLSIILTPDISNMDVNFINLINKVIEKKETTENMKISIAFTINEKHTNAIRKMYYSDVSIFRWDAGAILPFGIFLSDKTILLTILSNVSNVAEYSFGITMDNATDGMIDGFRHLVNWCHHQLCKKAVFEKKGKKTKQDKNLSQDEKNSIDKKTSLNNRNNENKRNGSGN